MSTTKCHYMLYTQQDDSKFTTAELTTPLLLQCNICSTQQLDYKEMQLKSLKYIFSNYNLKQYTIRKHSKPRKYQFMCPIINDRLSRNSWKTNTHTHTHTHTHLTALCPGLPRWAGTRKVKPIWILLKQKTVSDSGISWAICKCAPRSNK